MPGLSSQSFAASKELDEKSYLSSSADDFEFVDGYDELPIRTKELPPQYPLNLEIHPLRNNDAILVSIHPPRQPEDNIKHVPCDIVLVIDVSGSMAAAAPLLDVQDKEEKESSGLSILDLTKHAARTILETLNENDRLGIVTFSRDATIVQQLTKMTPDDKKATSVRIEALVDDGATNLWAGIRQGLSLFEQNPRQDCISGMYVLTDGQPNMMCPSQGYVTKLKPMLHDLELRAVAPSIHTFGFGYDIYSHLLQSIAEVGNGNYAFIPDVGMIGTVFVHAVANLYSTYATSATLTLQTSSRQLRLSSTSGIPHEKSDSQLTLKLGNIQYGQSRDTAIQYLGPSSKTVVHATLKYTLSNGTTKAVDQTVHLSSKTSLTESVVQYHLHRTRLCSHLSSLFPLSTNGEYAQLSSLPIHARNHFASLADSLQTSLKQSPADPSLLSLLQDIVGLNTGQTTSGEGQILQALHDKSWARWGRHYLRSLLHAHMRQTCNSFKDPGPLRYGIESPLFVSCRDELDKAFDTLPAPTPTCGDWVGRHSLVPGHSGGVSSGPQKRSKINMSRFNSSSNVCFLGDCTVGTGLHGITRIRVDQLKQGTSIWCPTLQQERRVTAVIKTATTQPNQKICKIGNSLWITEWHPILHSTNKTSSPKWIFPTTIAQETRNLEIGEPVYSILLEHAVNPDAHTIEVEGITCVTLGHGLTTPQPQPIPSSSPLPSTSTTNKAKYPSPSQQNPQDEATDARIHPFFGNYTDITANLLNLNIDPNNGHFICTGVIRDTSTGLACGFMPALKQVESQFDEKKAVGFDYREFVVCC